jgi:cell division septal protein FtsQ
MKLQTFFTTKKAAFIAAGVLALGILVWVLALSWQHNRIIKRVHVVGTRLVRAQEITALISLPPSQAVQDMNTAEIERAVLRHSFVKSASVFSGASDVLTVSIEERTPIALVLHKGRQYFADADAVLMPYRLTETPLDLPVISALGDSPLDSARLAPLLSIMRELQTYNEELYRLLSEIDLAPSGKVVLHLAGIQPPVYFGEAEKNARAKFARLEAFLRYAGETRLKVGQFEYIDIRWARQIAVAPRSQ